MSQAQYPIGKRTWFKPAAAIAAKSASVIHYRPATHTTKISNPYGKTPEEEKEKTVELRVKRVVTESKRTEGAYSVPVLLKCALGNGRRL